jgi:UDP-N-acetylglucosamine--N-acetylmuramyl-(pentapeptide) pyrophosphoryl-undecaprenol N-acetylglucosamine transferase
VYPALSVLKLLMSLKPESLMGDQVTVRQAALEELQVLWVGGNGGMEADIVKREGLRFEAIPAAGLHGVGARALPGNLWQLSRGFFSSRRILRKFQPDVLFFTGSFIGVPMALAARVFSRTKSLTFVPDIEPSLALKSIARFSDCITLSIEQSQAFFPKHRNQVVTGYPLRPDLDQWTKAEARSFFALREELPVLLVFGGSKGARSINQAVVNALPVLLQEMQIIHITGKLDWQMIELGRKGLSTEQINRYRPYPFLYDEIGAAMRLADLALTRAGASTLGELPLFGLPAILVPYPYAWRYQRVNASYLAKRGAAVVVEDARLAEQIVPQIQDLMSDRTRREQMSEAMQALARPDAAEKIAHLLIDLAVSKSNRGAEYVHDPAD